MSKILADSASDFTLEKLFKLVDGFGYIKSYSNPLLIIKYGPPGSGKTSADNRIEQLFNVRLGNFAKIDKDSPLVAIDDFRKGSLSIIKKYDGLAYKTQPVIKKVVALQNRILASKNKEGLSIIDKIPIALQRAFDYNLNVLWETTGQSSGSQALMDLVFNRIPKFYKIIIVFPIVSLQTAKKRVLQRAVEHLAEDPPYYRPVPVSQVKRATEMSHKYFKETIIPKVLDGTIYQLFCFDNELPLSLQKQEVRSNIKRTTRKRVAPGWKFGLNKTGKRAILKDGRPDIK